MSIINCYSDHEWRIILQGPTLATLWVIQADRYSPDVAQLKMHAGATAMFDIVSTPEVAQGELVSTVIAALLSGQRPAEMPAQPHSLREARRIVLAACGRVAGLLAQKTPHPEAGAYIGWLTRIARRVALAGPPGSPADQRAIQAVVQLEAVLWGG